MIWLNCGASGGRHPAGQPGAGPARLPVIAVEKARGALEGSPHYAASKGGVLSLTKSIAREFDAHGIRANAILSAMIDGLPPERLRGIVEAIPLQRTGTIAEVAGTCLFLRRCGRLR